MELGNNFKPFNFFFLFAVINESISIRFMPRRSQVIRDIH